MFIPDSRVTICCTDTIAFPFNYGVFLMLEVKIDEYKHPNMTFHKKVCHTNIIPKYSIDLGKPHSSFQYLIWKLHFHPWLHLYICVQPSLSYRVCQLILCHNNILIGDWQSLRIKKKMLGQAEHSIVSNV